MPEKGANPITLYISRSNSWFTRRFPIITLVIFLGMLIIWSIDGSTIRSSLNAWRNGRDYISFKLHKPVNFTQYGSPTPINSTKFELSFINSTRQNLNSSKLEGNFTTQESLPSLVNVSEVEPVFPSKLSSIVDVSKSLLGTSLSWISAELEPNYSSNLLSRWLAPGGEPCRDSKTVEISIPAFDVDNSKEFSTGEIHEIVIQALDDSGNRHCLGGDYFEIDLSGESWKTRPPLTDPGDGSYSFKLQVHPDFAGEYNLTIVLLFQHFGGLRFSPTRFVYWKELRRIPIKFYKNSVQLPELSICQKSDFLRDVWSGLLESNGWVYSAHCSFKIFSADSAWECLQNRWIFFWGDSNHVDSIRNLLNFVLGLPDIQSVPRRFDMNFTNPSNTSQSVRITSIFNGHWNETLNYQGLNSLQNEDYRNLLKGYFLEQTVPDTIIMNSGLHDGVYWKNIRAFIKGAEFATKFWGEVLESVKQRGFQVPRLLYRTTIATGGYARSLAFNPNKMEAFNGVVLDKLKSAGILSGAIDDFDMTFPWHYDNRCNDGVHYGRAPAKAKWRDGKIGHQYFVDLMLGHVLLNALCARH
ncbi:hypothetical protein IFM89_017588 [Coptis chinensis]|uniref:Uncharacterized protein n=1 Tax=Coptis chinensis TaxID=261450 RepID=A0A835HVM5_9MAGN|nr:hypothetical protein IFM89_017588 [Coptis chinensis]